MNAVEKRGSRRQQHNSEADPFAGMQADGEKHRQKAEVGRMAHEPVESRAGDLLRILNGHVGAEGFAQGKDRGPTNGKSGQDHNHASGLQLIGAAKHIASMSFTEPLARGDGGRNDDPQNQQRAPVLYFSAAALGAFDDADENLGCKPAVEKESPNERERRHIVIANEQSDMSKP